MNSLTFRQITGYLKQIDYNLGILDKNLDTILKAMQRRPPVQGLNLDSRQQFWELHGSELVRARWLIVETQRSVKALRQVEMNTFWDGGMYDFFKPITLPLSEDIVEDLPGFPGALTTSPEVLRNISYIAKPILVLMRKTRPIMRNEHLVTSLRSFQVLETAYGKLLKFKNPREYMINANF